MPVMEGKAMLFKEFAGVDAFPLCLATRDVDRIVGIVTLAPTFGAINLEDISAPRCFEIERRLRAELDIPVFHDDQHGTAIVVLAALMNSLRVVDKRAASIRVVVVGAGAAGLACTEIMLAHGVRDIVVCDLEGALYTAGAGSIPNGWRWPRPRTRAGSGVWLTTCSPAQMCSWACPGPGRCRRPLCARWRPDRSSSPWRTRCRGTRGGGRRRRDDHGHRTFRLPEPDQ